MDVYIDDNIPKFSLSERTSKDVVDLILVDIHSDTNRNVILSQSPDRSSISNIWDLPVCHEDLWQDHG